MQVVILAVTLSIFWVSNASMHAQLQGTANSNSSPSRDQLLIRKKRLLPLILAVPALYSAAGGLAGAGAVQVVGAGIASGISSVTGAAATAGTAAAAATSGAAGGLGTFGTALGAGTGGGSQAVIVGKLGISGVTNAGKLVHIGRVVSTGMNPLNSIIPQVPVVPLPMGTPAVVGDAANAVLAAERQRMINTAGQKASNHFFGWIHRGNNREAQALIAAGAALPVVADAAVPPVFAADNEFNGGIGFIQPYPGGQLAGSFPSGSLGGNPLGPDIGPLGGQTPGGMAIIEHLAGHQLPLGGPSNVAEGQYPPLGYQQNPPTGLAATTGAEQSAAADGQARSPGLHGKIGNLLGFGKDKNQPAEPAKLAGPSSIWPVAGPAVPGPVLPGMGTPVPVNGGQVQPIVYSWPGAGIPVGPPQNLVPATSKPPQDTQPEKQGILSKVATGIANMFGMGKKGNRD